MLIFVPFVVEQLVRLLPSIPPKPKAPEEPDDSDDEDEQDMCKMEKAQHDADLEVWKEEVKLVARGRMEEVELVLDDEWNKNQHPPLSLRSRLATMHIRNARVSAIH
jgi:hypothetical protein